MKTGKGKSRSNRSARITEKAVADVIDRVFHEPKTLKQLYPLIVAESEINVNSAIKVLNKIWDQDSNFPDVKGVIEQCKEMAEAIRSGILGVHIQRVNAMLDERLNKA